MKRSISIILTSIMFFLATGSSLYSMEEESLIESDTPTFDLISQLVAEKDGVREIRYDEFVAIRDSGEDYILLDVLYSESYADGHIEGAQSFPLDSINKESTEERIPKDANIIVYCRGFTCSASTQAAKKLTALGYDVIDYKGGLAEWKEKGNSPVKK